MQLDEFATAALRELEAGHLLRRPRSIDTSQGPEVEIEGRSVLCLCSNNYLGFANHPRFGLAVSEALERCGYGACASRHVSGSMRVHVELESRIASFLKRARGLFFATGYNANLGTLQALSGPRTLLLSDALNHASLIDGCRLGGGTTRVYRHLDVEHVETLLRAERARHDAALIVTESLFSMDGDVAPLAALRGLCDRYDAALMVDDSHAVGAMGAHGVGLATGAEVRADVITGTFGKAFGASGAFVAGSDPVVRLIENRARCYIFSTAPSPVVPAAALAAFELVEAADDRRAALRERARTLRDGLRHLGFQVPASDTHIIPVLLGAPDRAMEMSRQLFERGVFVHGIRPPTVPEGTSRLRVVAMATHSAEHISRALGAFGELVR